MKQEQAGSSAARRIRELFAAAGHPAPDPATVEADRVAAQHAIASTLICGCAFDGVWTYCEAHTHE